MRRMEWLFDAIQFQKIGLLYYAKPFCCCLYCFIPSLPPTCIHEQENIAEQQQYCLFDDSRENLIKAKASKMKLLFISCFCLRRKLIRLL